MNLNKMIAACMTGMSMLMLLLAIAHADLTPLTDPSPAQTNTILLVALYLQILALGQWIASAQKRED